MELVKLDECIKLPNYKKKNIIIDFSIIMLVIILYIGFVVLLNNRDVFLLIIFFASFILSLLRIYVIIKSNECDLVIISMKLFCTWLFTNVVIKNHNPFYHSLLFWLPFDEIFRGIFIIKVMNILFEIELKDNKKYEDNSTENGVTNIIKKGDDLQSSFISSYQIFNELFTQIFPNNTRMFKIIFLLIVMKISYFFISDYYLPKNYHKVVHSKKYFICSNLFNNEIILDDWTQELKKLIDYLGKDNVYVSILENGDSTDNTGKKLNDFKSELDKMNVQNTITTEKVVIKSFYNRIGFLQRIRNRVIEPMLNILKWKPEEFLIIFINDIIYKWQDIIKLIMTNEMQYDMACGLDFYFGFYDVWVSRDLNGNKLRNYYPYFIDRNAQNRVINGENIRVFSCWNGVAIINPKPFYKVPNLVFRDGKSIKESECFYLCHDFWKDGYNKILLNPNVKFTYEYLYYYWNRYFAPVFLIHSYFYYYFNYIFEFDPNSGNLNDNNIIINKEWKFYT